MIEVLPESSERVVGLSLGGRVSKQEYRETLVPKVHDVVQEYGRCRLLVRLAEDFEGFEDGAAVEARDFGLKHRCYLVQRLAIVAATPAQGATARLVGHLVSEWVRVFTPEAQAEAWAWVKQESRNESAAWSAHRIIGASVRDPMGGDMGEVDDLVIDPASGSVRVLVVAHKSERWTVPYHLVRLRGDGTVLLKLDAGDASRKQLTEVHEAPHKGHWRPDISTFKFESHPGLGGPRL